MTSSDSGPQGEAARDRLAAGRSAAQARLAALERELSGIVEATESASTDDEHDP